ncbi:MAG TPA: hypothetical protein VNF50_10855 [Acidimicrobiales bacterium]|nr:hypothetical protein [Acidimicrobiales bacterium]
MCKQCGQVWVVPRYYARSHAGGSPAASGVGYSRTGVELINQSVDRRGQQENTWRAFQVCPHCRTEKKYVQRRLWFTGKALNLE